MFQGPRLRYLRVPLGPISRFPAILPHSFTAPERHSSGDQGRTFQRAELQGLHDPLYLGHPQ
jgi:hypothetical protein